MKKREVDQRSLLDFIKSTKIHLNNMDDILKILQGEDGKRAAREMNRFNLDFDRFLFFACGVKLEDLQKVLNKSFKLP